MEPKRQLKDNWSNGIVVRAIQNWGWVRLHRFETTLRDCGDLYKRYLDVSPTTDSNTISEKGYLYGFNTH